MARVADSGSDYPFCILNACCQRTQLRCSHCRYVSTLRTTSLLLCSDITSELLRRKPDSCRRFAELISWCSSNINTGTLNGPLQKHIKCRVVRFPSLPALTCTQLKVGSQVNFATIRKICKMLCCLIPSDTTQTPLQASADNIVAIDKRLQVPVPKETRQITLCLITESTSKISLF
jgi:hypothetical protein